MVDEINISARMLHERWYSSEKCAVTNFGLKNATETGMATGFLLLGSLFTAMEFQW